MPNWNLPDDKISALDKSNMNHRFAVSKMRCKVCGKVVRQKNKSRSLVENGLCGTCYALCEHFNFSVESRAYLLNEYSN